MHEEEELSTQANTHQDDLDYSPAALAEHASKALRDE